MDGQASSWDLGAHRSIVKARDQRLGSNRTTRVLYEAIFIVLDSTSCPGMQGYLSSFEAKKILRFDECILSRRPSAIADGRTPATPRLCPPVPVITL